MRFLLDENVDLRLLTSFKSDQDITSIVKIHTNGLSDEEVLAIAVQEKRILITNDKDFGELVVRRRLPHCGILLYRLKDESLENVQKRLHYVLTHYKNQLHHFLVITQKNVRIRKNTEKLAA